MEDTGHTVARSGLGYGVQDGHPVVQDGHLIHPQVPGCCVIKGSSLLKTRSSKVLGMGVSFPYPGSWQQS